jgi:hypothetical protein
MPDAVADTFRWAFFCEYLLQDLGSHDYGIEVIEVLLREGKYLNQSFFSGDCGRISICDHGRVELAQCIPYEHPIIASYFVDDLLLVIKEWRKFVDLGEVRSLGDTINIRCYFTTDGNRRFVGENLRSQFVAGILPQGDPTGYAMIDEIGENLVFGMATNRKIMQFSRYNIECVGNEVHISGGESNENIFYIYKSDEILRLIRWSKQLPFQHGDSLRVGEIIIE